MFFSFCFFFSLFSVEKSILELYYSSAIQQFLMFSTKHFMNIFDLIICFLSKLYRYFWLGKNNVHGEIGIAKLQNFLSRR